MSFLNEESPILVALRFSRGYWKSDWFYLACLVFDEHQQKGADLYQNK